MERPNQTQARNVIVVGTDLGAGGAEAMREALRLAEKLPGPELHVVHVVTIAEGRNALAIARLSQRLDHAQRQLARHVSRVLHDEGLRERSAMTTLHPRVGQPARAVHQVAVDYEADFIVVGTRKRSSLMRWLEGSVSRELASIAHCPVLIAHPKDYGGLQRSPSIAPPRPEAPSRGVRRDELHGGEAR